MEKKEQATKIDPFENLKKLNSIISKKEFNAIFTDIKTTKQGLVVLCNKIKQNLNKSLMEAAIEKQDAQKEQKQQSTTQKVATTSVKTDNKDKNFNQRPNNFAHKDKKFEKPNERFARTDARQGQRFDKAQAPKVDSRAPGNKPASKDRVTFTNTNPKSNFKPKSFTPPVPVTTIASKQTSLGGNKAKSKASDVEKKGLNIKEKIRMGHVRFDNNSASEEGIVKFRNKKTKTS